MITWMAYVFANTRRAALLLTTADELKKLYEGVSWPLTRLESKEGHS